MPFSGHLAALHNFGNGLTLGGNAAFYGNGGEGEIILSSHADFQRMVGYVEMMNYLRNMSMVDQQLAGLYAANYVDALRETTEGIIMNGGARLAFGESPSGFGGISGIWQSSAGPLGAALDFSNMTADTFSADFADMALRATLFFPLWGQCNGRVAYETRDEAEAGERSHGGMASIACHY